MCKLSFVTIHWNKKYKINFHTFEVTSVMRVLHHLFLFFGIGHSNTHAKNKNKNKKLVIYNNPTPKPSLRASILSMAILSSGSRNNIYHKFGKCRRCKPNAASCVYLIQGAPTSPLSRDVCAWTRIRRRHETCL